MLPMLYNKNSFRKFNLGTTIPVTCLLCLAFASASAGNDTEKFGADDYNSRQFRYTDPNFWYTPLQKSCGINRAGVCVLRGTCRRTGGAVNAVCAYGMGECCNYVQRCNSNRNIVDVDQLVTSLETPYQATAPCSFRFRKQPNICQIKLEFVSYTSTSANFDGVCDRDTFRVSNTITVKNFTTCGTLTGQHMYLTFGHQDSIMVTPNLKMNLSSYKITAIRIPCNSNEKAPDYCLQYFTNPTDMVKSFDFGTQQQNGQQYTVCVRPQLRSEEITWQPCGWEQNAFDIITTPIDSLPIPPATFQCTTDWIQFKGGDKMCLPFTQITSKWKPYEVVVNFDEREYPEPVKFSGNFDPADCEASCNANNVPGVVECACSPNSDSCNCVIASMPTADVENRGFCLEYSQ